MVQGMGVSCTGVTSMTAWSTEDHPDASSNHQDVCTQHSSPRPSSSSGGGGNGSKQRGRVFSSDGTGGGSGGGGNLGASSLCKVMVAPPSGLSMLLSSSEGSCGRLRCEAAGQVGGT